MSGVIVKSVILGLIVGGASSLLYGLLTASTSGRNVMTGEAMELKGFKAVYIQISENGFANYFGTLVPSFLIFSFLAILIFGAIFWMGAKNA